jgi:hypothetical protein
MKSEKNSRIKQLLKEHNELTTRMNEILIEHLLFVKQSGTLPKKALMDFRELNKKIYE